MDAACNASRSVGPTWLCTPRGRCLSGDLGLPPTANRYFTRFVADGNGNFTDTFTGTLPPANGAERWGIWGAADLDYDGQHDLFMAQGSVIAGTTDDIDWRYRIALGNSDGSYRFGPITENIVTDQRLARFRLADVNGDGNKDLVYFSIPHGESYDDQRLHAGRPRGRDVCRVAERQLLVTTDYSANDITLADLDHDGDMDFFLSADDDVRRSGPGHDRLQPGLRHFHGAAQRGPRSEMEWPGSESVCGPCLRA